jgi:hypothetical protein
VNEERRSKDPSRKANGGRSKHSLTGTSLSERVEQMTRRDHGEGLAGGGFRGR